MRHAWITGSMLCLIVAAVLLLRENYDAAFVAAALGMVAWFLNYRSKIRETIIEPDETIEDEADASDEEDER
jgi:hypothetical protein